MECKFCKKTLKTVYSLKTHQKSAKYCLKIQGKKILSNKCKFCDKTFSTKQNLHTHLTVCSEKVSQNTKLTYEERIKILLSSKDEQIAEKNRQLEEKDRQLAEKDKQSEEKLEIIRDLQNKLENIAIKAVSKPTTTNINNSKTINMYNKFTPITEKHLQDQAQFLTIEHIKKGAQGYAKYALEHPFKDNIVCVDYARRKIKYKNSDNDIVSDPDMVKLSAKMFAAIEDRNSELIIEHCNELKNLIMRKNLNSSNEMTDNETRMFSEEMNHIMDRMLEISSYRHDVKNIANGMKPDIYKDIVKSICSNSSLE